MSKIKETTRRLTPPPGYDRESYNRGWRAGLSTGSNALEAADSRNEADAWYDGYADQAAGREKWHHPNCAAHHNGPGGCGVA